MLDNGLIYEEGNNERLKIMWFKVLEREGGQAYPLFRVVRLMQLRLIPMDVRADPGVLARMRSVLRGLYGAEVELVYLVAGMFHPRRLGIVQLYGVVGRGSNLAGAEQLALNSAAALEAEHVGGIPADPSGGCGYGYGSLAGLRPEAYAALPAGSRSP